MFYEIIEEIKEMQIDLMENGIVLARKPIVEKDADDNIVITIDYLQDGEEWESITTIEV